VGINVTLGSISARIDKTYAWIEALNKRLELLDNRLESRVKALEAHSAFSPAGRPEVISEAVTLCPHNRPAHDCDDCDRQGDQGYDAAREQAAAGRTRGRD